MKRAFLGANSGCGFINHFKTVVPPSGEYKLIILKGGSGTGKSTLMRKAIEFASSVGCESESYACSSDPESLDGVFIPKIKSAIIDGTAPHTVDPQAYGAFGVIVNMGEAVRETGLPEKLPEILAVTEEKAACYEAGYSYLSAAYSLMGNVMKRYIAASNGEILSDITLDLIAFLDLKRSGGEGSSLVRPMFLSSFTPNGYVDYASQLGAKRVFLLKGGDIGIYGGILQKVLEAARRNGLQINCYMNPLLPAVLDAVYLYDSDTLILSESFFRTELIGGESIDVSCAFQSIDTKLIDDARSETAVLAGLACEQFKRAYDRHQILEKIYRPFVDFERVNAKISEVITRLQA